MKRISLLLVMAISLFLSKIYSQEIQNPITTAAPFLLIAPDARAGGMGDLGVATSTDANSQHWNPSKYAFSQSQYTIGVNYTPWLRNLTGDVFLGSVVFSNKLNDRSAWATSLTYFSLGRIELRQTDDASEVVTVAQPNELAIDGSYSLKLSKTFSMSIALRYVRADFALKVVDSDLRTVNTFTGDISGYFQSRRYDYNSFSGVLRAGFNISNIGPKVKLSEGGQDSFMPTNMKLGGGYEFILDPHNSFSANVEFNKLLVPTPPLRGADGSITSGSDDDVNFLSGMFRSFGDAPGGFSEEIKEFTWAAGLEYSYDNVFSLRTGYFNESESKGSRKYMTVGAGFKFKSSKIDLSYLISTSKIANDPLENTLRFSLTFDIGDSVTP